MEINSLQNGLNYNPNAAGRPRSFSTEKNRCAGGGARGRVPLRVCEKKKLRLPDGGVAERWKGPGEGLDRVPRGCDVMRRGGGGGKKPNKNPSKIKTDGREKKGGVPSAFVQDVAGPYPSTCVGRRLRRERARPSLRRS